MDDDQQFCLRWNNHQSTLVAVFDTLLEKGMHVDCTLAAEGQTLKAHKVVLSACSPYFESVLSQQFDKHPIIILKDVKYAELRAMMDYMYRGEVNISQDQLAALLKAAESLQIKGLSDNKPSRPPSRPAPAAPSHPPRAPSPPPQVRDGSIDSREGSVSPTRRRKKARRMSDAAGAGAEAHAGAGSGAEGAPASSNGDEPLCKEEAPRDALDDLTLDEDANEPPGTYKDVVRNFQWHMKRSQDEMMNSSDNVRDSQEPLKEAARLPSALLSLLSMQHARSQRLALVSPRLALAEPHDPHDPLNPHDPHDPLAAIPENVKAHLLHHAFAANNNAAGQGAPHPHPHPQDDYKPDKEESDNEYDDTDDIVLPEEADAYYGMGGAGGGGTGAGAGVEEYETGEAKGRLRRSAGSSGDDASRQFECRHCGKKYRWKSTLRRHENVECGGKPPAHQCPYCAYRAKQRGNLGVHIRKHHNDEWYVYASNKVRRNKKTSV